MTIVVTRAIGLVSIQDLGRPGRMHEALAPGGALVPELLVAANRAAGNADGAAAIEVCGKLVVTTETGASIEVVSEPLRVAYLAIRGGVDAPVVLGSRSTQRSAGIGALLRAGDRIAGDPVPPIPWDPGDAPIRVIPGPDEVPGALDHLLATGYRISPQSDRVGTRLDGPAIATPADGWPSRPMVRGAIELPGDGKPVVLGPEHPTTGGYPIIAVIAQADLGRFFAIRLGGTVRFRRGT
ncbi:MAG: biotin-dependent carboxyltransferase family protein [Kofleriaceae bacterium]